MQDILSGLAKSITHAAKSWFHYTLVAIAWLGVVPLTACKYALGMVPLSFWILEVQRLSFILEPFICSYERTSYMRVLVAKRLCLLYCRSYMPMPVHGLCQLLVNAAFGHVIYVSIPVCAARLQPRLPLALGYSLNTILCKSVVVLPMWVLLWSVDVACLEFLTRLSSVFFAFLVRCSKVLGIEKLKNERVLGCVLLVSSFANRLEA